MIVKKENTIRITCWEFFTVCFTFSYGMYNNIHKSV